MAKKEKEIQKLEKETAQPSFWKDTKKAKEVTQKLDSLREQVSLWNGLVKEINEILELAILAEKEKDVELEKEIEQRFKSLNKAYAQHEFEVLMSGKYDQNNAIMMIHAGTGGTEAQDWAEILLRMYLRYCEKRGWQTNVVDKTPGQEAGIKSATIKITGPYSYGYLKAEAGIHRLVRISPFDAEHMRHTSFALVEVIPEIEEEKEIEIKPEDIKVDTFRASGAGGQYVQKTSSAVRITHLPTKIVVSCQNERSQYQNKQTALRILRSKLEGLKLQEEEQKKAKLRGEHLEPSWGNQIRSYVLHPYHMVKDLRTEYETSDTEAVLDGKIDGFIEAYLKWKK